MKAGFLRLTQAIPLAMIFVGIPLLFGGCSSPDPDNQAQRPWGGAQNWNGSLPTSMTEGR
jgi:hypothetical protein